MIIKYQRKGSTLAAKASKIKCSLKLIIELCDGIRTKGILVATKTTTITNILDGRPIYPPSRGLHLRSHFFISNANVKPFFAPILVASSPFPRFFRQQRVPIPANSNHREWMEKCQRWCKKWFGQKWVVRLTGNTLFSGDLNKKEIGVVVGGGVSVLN